MSFWKKEVRGEKNGWPDFPQEWLAGKNFLPAGKSDDF